MPNIITRRKFLQASATAAAATSLLGGKVITAAAPKEKLRFAMIACGGRGGAHFGFAGREDIVALCDADLRAAKGRAKKFTKAKVYGDYRKLFDEMTKSIDAVVVATPDHNHYPAAMRALKAGKAVYCEKPLTWGVWEAQQLAIEAAKQKVATQMGNQGNAGQGWRITYEYVKAGAIGDVKEVHTWTNRPIWPQGMGRPEGKDPIPSWLDWEAWLGPAPMRPHKGGRVYLPFVWRGWHDFGAGALGDMACHTMNAMFQVMGTDYPTNVELVEATGRNDESFPRSEIIKWVFPRNDKRPGYTAYWYDGGRKPKRPPELEQGRRIPGTGTMFVGTKGTILVGGDYNNSPRLIPEAKQKEFGKPKQLLERSPGHSNEFMMAAKGDKPWNFPKSNFTYAGPMTAVMSLGVVAEKVGTPLEFDPKTLKFTNSDKANALLRRTPRKGWEKYM